MPEFFSANGNTLKVDMSGDYDPGISVEVDRQIRNMLQVRGYCAGKARELLAATGSSNFEVVHGGGPSRPREYVVPKNRDGIHEELSQAVLLKAALGMTGK